MAGRWRLATAVACLCLMGGQALAESHDRKRPPSRQPGPAPRAEEAFDVGGGSELERLCAEKIAMALPLATVAVSALRLKEITVHIEKGYYTVLLPLKEPQGPIRSLYWGADSLEEISTFIELLQDGKLMAVRAEASSFDFRSEEGRRPSNDELIVCAQEQILKFLDPCKDCEILEWVFKGREDGAR